MAFLSAEGGRAKQLFLALVAVLSVTATTTYAARYVVKQIVAPTPSSSVAKSINKTGMITGTRTDVTFGNFTGTPRTTNKVFIFNNHSSMILGGPSSSDGSAINGAGQIAGNGLVGSYQHAMLWTNWLNKDLGVLPDTFSSFANGVNDAGTVVGVSGDYPFIWQNGVMSQLGTAKGAAYSINSFGVVAGSANNVPVMWEANGNMTPLATTTGAAYRIIDGGPIVGYVNNNGTPQPFFWLEGTLNFLPLLPGQTGGEALSLNNSGISVGYGNFTEAPYTRAMSWRIFNAQTDLNTLIAPDSGWVLTKAWDINSAGQIVGEGIFNGTTQAFLLTPIALPVTNAITSSRGLSCPDWHTSSVSIDLLAADNSGSGIKEIRYSIDGAVEVVVPGQTANVVVSSEGAHTFEFHAVDNLGQVEAVKTLNLKIDGTVPVSEATISGTSGTNGWFRSPVNVKVTGNDATSGVNRIEYRKNINGAWGSVVYSPNPAFATFGNFSSTTANGRFKLGYKAVDQACIAEVEKVVDVNIDTVAPVTTFAASPAANGRGWANSDVTITFNAVDNLSGVDAITLNGVVTSGSIASYLLGEGLSTVSYGATDEAGNVEPLKTATFRVDKTAPVVSVSTSPAILAATNKSKLVPVTITGSATDDRSGVATVVITITDEYGLYNQTVTGFDTVVNLDTYKKKNDTNGRMYTINATATDLAGNQSTSLYSLLVK